MNKLTDDKKENRLPRWLYALIIILGLAILKIALN